MKNIWTSHCPIQERRWPSWQDFIILPDSGCKSTTKSAESTMLFHFFAAKSTTFGVLSDLVADFANCIAQNIYVIFLAYYLQIPFTECRIAADTTGFSGFHTISRFIQNDSHTFIYIIWHRITLQKLSTLSAVAWRWQLLATPAGFHPPYCCLPY